jgi:ABC-type dipeptide/oligopeptide/nickel transport system permease subunit
MARTNFTAASAGAAPKQERSHMWLQTLKRSVKSPTAKLGVTIFLIITIACILAPFIAPYSLEQIDLLSANQGPSVEHILGTDQLGRDILTRILYGGRYSLILAFVTCLANTFAATVIGSIAGYFGGMVETVIMRIMDVWSALPGELLAILISSALGGGFFNTVLALGVGGVPGGVRIIRGQILAERSKEYLEAAEAFNCSKISIMFRHLLPNVFSPMIIQFTMGVGGTITSAAGLSYIGLGVQPPTPEWGAMLSDARSHMMTYPHLILVPGIAIALIILACNLYGDGLRDALDPRLRQ